MRRLQQVFMWTIGILLGFFVLAIALLPMLVRQQIEQTYRQQGADYLLDIGELSFSVWQSAITLKDVQARFLGRTNHIDKLYINLNPWALLQQRIDIQELYVLGTNLDINKQQNKLHIAGVTIDLSAPQKAPKKPNKSLKWQLKIDNLELIDNQINAQLNKPNSHIKFNIENFKLKQLDSSTARSAPFTLNINLQQGRLDQQLTLLAPLTLKLKGQVMQPNKQPYVIFSAQLQSLFMRLQNSHQLQLEQASIKQVIAKLETQQIDAINLNELSLTRLIRPSNDNNQSQSSEPMVYIQQMQLTDIQRQAKTVQLSALQAKQLHLSVAQKPADPIEIQLNQLNVQQMVFKNPMLNLQQINLEELNIQQSNRQTMQLKAYQSQDINYQNQILTLGKQTFSGLKVWLKRNPQGQLVGLPKTQPKKPKDPSDAPHKTPFYLRLSELTQSDSSYIYWHDQAVMPNINQELKLQKFKLSQLDTQQKTPVKLELLGAMDKFNHIQIKADISPQIRSTGKLNLRIQQLNLVPLSGYMQKSLGYQVEHGMLALDLNAKLNQGQLQGIGKLNLRNSQFTPVNQALIKRLSQQLKIPINTALELMSNDEKQVNIAFPLSGNLNNPEIGISGIASQFLQDILVKASMSYLKYILNPVGAVIAAVEVGNELLFSIRLKPLKFASNSDKLNRQQRTYLNKIAQMMHTNNSLQLKVCPQVIAGEHWQAQAQALAQQVKQHLSQQQANLAPRVVTCKGKQGKDNQVLLGF